MCASISLPRAWSCVTASLLVLHLISTFGTQAALLEPSCRFTKSSVGHACFPSGSDSRIARTSVVTLYGHDILVQQDEIHAFNAQDVDCHNHDFDRHLENFILQPFDYSLRDGEDEPYSHTGSSANFSSAGDITSYYEPLDISLESMDQTLSSKIQGDVLMHELNGHSHNRNDTVANDLDSLIAEKESGGKSRIWMSHRSIWQRRNARSAEEGIRREKLPQLSSLLLEKAKALDVQSPRYAARTIAGLVSALAEEVNDLDVEVVTQPDTPFWDKHVDEVRISFSRLGFSPIKMRGLHHAIEEYSDKYPDCVDSDFSKKLQDLSCADEAFKQIDVDNSGFLDRDEIGEALILASGATDEGDDRRIIEELASDLLELYDVNGDGVISRGEYQLMVEDMAALVQKQQEQPAQKNNRDERPSEMGASNGTIGAVRQFFGNIFSRERNGQDDDEATDPISSGMNEFSVHGDDSSEMNHSEYVINTSESVEMIESMGKSLGSVTLSDLKLDLRRLVFGAVPVIKHITPGGPLILEPFTVTVTASFDREDIMKSSLLEAGLSQLIGLVLRRRVRSLRDLTDLAVLFGRDYKLTSKNAPVTEVVELSNVEFDEMNRLVMTGRAKVRTRPGAPTIDQAFKVRAKLGTRKGGRFIRLVEPELAFVLECPKTLEEG